MHAGKWIVAAAAVVAAAGCGSGTAATTGQAKAEEPPAKVEALPGKSVKSVKLSDHAAKRVGIETTTVGNGTVPYSAVLYSADGASWVYTVTQPLTYTREKVVVANVGGDQGSVAFISDGPPAGTTVVKTGVVELYGAELGVGK